MYGTSATDIVAYQYEAEHLCPTCVRRIAADVAESNGRNSEFVPLPDLLAIWAGVLGIDLEEDTPDTNDFPLPVFGSQIESDEEKCGSCHEPLI